MKVEEQNLQVLGHAICRSPLFPIESELADVWPVLKRLIKDSAPEFYAVIANLDAADLQNQSEKIRFTIWKYFNRSRYRATPFGEFAAISTIPIQKHIDAIVLQQGMDILSLPDWKAIQNISYDHRSLEKANYRTNPLCYRYDKELHYLFRSEKQFELNAIERREDIDLLYGFCKELRSFQVIAAMMQEQLGMKKRNVMALIKQLLDLQVLACDLQVNITGQDYFERRKITRSTEQHYTIASRICPKGGLNQELTQELKDYATFLSQCLPVPRSTQQEQFKNSFLQLWEQRSVPLSLALDPILGIGYGHENELLQTTLVGELQQRPPLNQNQQLFYGKFEQFVLSQMIKGKPIQLADFKPAVQHLPLPNTSSILFHIYEGHPVIHQAGGATATALLGRFTVINELRDFSLQLTAIEQNANAGVTFFDIAYQFEGRTDNVNRRQQLYNTELAIGSWSTFEKPLRLEDIWVSVRNGQILLHHAESGARLMPRLASAYNHRRSDLDLFRFLCDLQYQDIQSRLSIDLQSMFPNLEHYPRVYYKNTIAGAAKWKLPKFQNVKDLRTWLKVQQITQPFTVGQNDQTLMIDPKITEDLNFLLLYQAQQTEAIYLTEALISTKQMVKNEDGKYFHAEFILPIVHHHQIYRPYATKEPPILRRDLRMPGGEWFYVELYLRPEITDEFLTNEIRNLIKQHKAMISRWFFIRYNQPEPHIRLRLKLKDPQQLPSILLSIQESINITVNYGHLKRLEIKAYDREIIRYGEKQIDLVEHFFYLDSTWALKQLSLSNDDLYAQILAFVQKLSEVIFNDLTEQIAFYRNLSERFATEMNFSKQDFKKINLSYQNQQMSKNTNEKLIRYFGKLIEHYEIERRTILLADLIHMHINRRFSGAPRMHEAVIYQFLSKLSLAKQYQTKSP